MGVSLDGTTLTVAGVTAQVRCDGYTKGNSVGGGPWREIVYLVAWADSDTFMDGLLGVFAYRPGKIQWPIPHAYPGNSKLYCVDCWAETAGPVAPDPTKLVKSDYAIVHARYAAVPFDIEAQQPDLAFGGQPVPWSRDTIRGYIQTYAVDKTDLVYKSDNTSLTSKFQRRIPHIEYRREVYGLQYPWLPQMQDYVGKLNSVPLWGNAKGTVLMEPFDVNIENNTDGSRMLTMQLTYVWRPYDWNMEPRPDGFGWDYVQVDGTTTMSYDYTDHNQLFTLFE